MTKRAEVDMWIRTLRAVDGMLPDGMDDEVDEWIAGLRDGRPVTERDAEEALEELHEICVDWGFPGP